MEQVGQFKAEVQLPAFTKGKLQLNPKEVKESRELAKNAHTHGEINCDGNAEVQHFVVLSIAFIMFVRVTVVNSDYLMPNMRPNDDSEKTLLERDEQTRILGARCNRHFQ